MTPTTLLPARIAALKTLINVECRLKCVAAEIPAVAA